MTDFKINGLVIGERELGDNDKLLTILSERYGKVIAIGKGVKSLKNRNMCCCQLFTYASFNLRKRGKYYFITESDLIENFFDIRNDILKLSLASYLCELINQVVQEGVEEDEILRLTLNSLYAINTDKQPLEIIRAAFQLKLVAESGMYPDITECSICGTEGVTKGYLDLVDGVIVCTECKNKANFTNVENPFAERGLQKPITIITEALIKVIEFIVSSDSKRFLSFSLDEQEWGLFFDFSERFLINQLERSFFTLDFYKSLL